MEYDVRSKPFHFKDLSQPVRVVIRNPSTEWIVITQDGEEGVSININYCSFSIMRVLLYRLEQKKWTFGTRMNHC